MEDVAARAGVSRALVSIVFRDAPGPARIPGPGSGPRRPSWGTGRTTGPGSWRARTGLIGVSFGVRAHFHADLVEALYAAAEGRATT